MIIMNVLLCDTSKEEQRIDILSRITAAQSCSGSGLLSDKERQTSGKSNMNCTFHKEAQKKAVISHCGVWLISKILGFATVTSINVESIL